MTVEDYRRALDAAIREYETLGEQRRGIDKRLEEVSQTITALSRLCGLTPTVSIGLTDGCRLVLRHSGVPMTPVEVRDHLAARGLDMTKYASDLSAIHTVLKRLNHAGEIRFVIRQGGKHAYVWNVPTTPVALGPALIQHMRESQPGAADAPAPAPSRRKGRSR